MEAQPGAIEAHTRAMEAHAGAKAAQLEVWQVTLGMEGYHGTMEGHPQAMKGYLGAIEDHPGAIFCGIPPNFAHRIPRNTAEVKVIPKRF
jgi:hypothetical protein